MSQAIASSRVSLCLVVGVQDMDHIEPISESPGGLPEAQAIAGLLAARRLLGKPATGEARQPAAVERRERDADDDGSDRREGEPAAGAETACPNRRRREESVRPRRGRAAAGRAIAARQLIADAEATIDDVTSPQGDTHP
jgi:hypothetical protein